MPNVQDIGTNFYAHRMRYPTKSFPLFEKGATQEIEWPFRTGAAVVARVPFTTTALVIGRWVSSSDEDDALTSAIGARPYVA